MLTPQLGLGEEGGSKWPIWYFIAAGGGALLLLLLTLVVYCRCRSRKQAAELRGSFGPRPLSQFSPTSRNKDFGREATAPRVPALGECSASSAKELPREGGRGCDSFATGRRAWLSGRMTAQSAQLSGKSGKGPAQQAVWRKIPEPAAPPSMCSKPQSLAGQRVLLQGAPAAVPVMLTSAESTVGELRPSAVHEAQASPVSCRGSRPSRLLWSSRRSSELASSRRSGSTMTSSLSPDSRSRKESLLGSPLQRLRSRFRSNSAFQQQPYSARDVETLTGRAACERPNTCTDVRATAQGESMKQRRLTPGSPSVRAMQYMQRSFERSAKAQRREEKSEKSASRLASTRSCPDGAAEGGAPPLQAINLSGGLSPRTPATPPFLSGSGRQVTGEPSAGRLTHGSLGRSCRQGAVGRDGAQLGRSSQMGGGSISFFRQTPGSSSGLFGQRSAEEIHGTGSARSDQGQLMTTLHI
jgi:hypothetical protein